MKRSRKETIGNFIAKSEEFKNEIVKCQEYEIAAAYREFDKKLKTIYKKLQMQEFTNKEKEEVLEIAQNMLNLGHDFLNVVEQFNKKISPLQPIIEDLIKEHEDLAKMQDKLNELNDRVNNTLI